jgi:glycosyltransferase Alg8
MGYEGIRLTQTADGRALRKGVGWEWQLTCLAGLILAAVVLWKILGDIESWALARSQILITLGSIAAWRWTWWTVHTTRAVIYNKWKYPRLRRQANEAFAREGQVPELAVLAVTYKEDPLVTAAAFDSLFTQCAEVEGLKRPPLIVVVTGSDFDDDGVLASYQRTCGDLAQEYRPRLVLRRGDTGKRPALAIGLVEIAADGMDPDGVVLFLDGDTVPAPQLFQRMLPFFRLKPEVAAVTTNEDGCSAGAGWFAEWITLRFAQRHRGMSSISLSERLLCLTGRLSAFRARYACNDSFREKVHCDSIEHWWWGRYEMLSGDDKSTWFWLASRGARLLYLPDVTATTYEVVEDSSKDRAIANLKRWSGNMVRNSGRVTLLGPGKLKLFPWWCSVDQRLATWTSLMGPGASILSLVSGEYRIAASYLLWVIASRCVTVIGWWVTSRRISFAYVPIQVLGEWTKSLVNVWTMAFPSKQAWFNRGRRTAEILSSDAKNWRILFANYFVGFVIFVFLVLVGNYTGLMPLSRESRLWGHHSPSRTISSTLLHRDKPDIQWFSGRKLSIIQNH